MATTESLRLKNGTEPDVIASRLAAPVTSPVLLAIPEAMRPKAVVACATCPEGDWSLNEKLVLTCECAARRYVSWTPSTDGLILCDAREAALAPDPS